MAEELTDDVKTLVGNPKKAILSMTLPIALSNLVQSANNMIDAIWVAGLGTAALAATGVAFPYFFIVMGIGNGIGIGASQAIARRIGAEDYSGTHKVAAQAFYMTLLASIIVTLVFTLFAEPLMVLSAAGDYMEECLAYAYPIFMTLPIALMCSLFTALLRAEGAAKRSMNMNVAGAVINIILDPIFIYGFGWGIAGAAWATVLSMVVSLVMGAYWYFGKKDTFVRIPLGHFRFDGALDRDILKVGIPASLEMVLMSLTGIVMNQIILSVDPVDGLAVYSTGWRALNMLTIPAMALGFALVPVCAAAYGAKRYDKIKEGFDYSLKFGLIVMVVITVFTLVAAPLIVAMFTYADVSKPLAPAMTEFIRIGSLFLPAMALGYSASGIFQGLGMGTKSLICTFIMNIMRLPICYLMSLTGSLVLVWWGLALSENLGSIIALVWGVIVLRVLMGEYAKVKARQA